MTNTVFPPNGCVRGRARTEVLLVHYIVAVERDLKKKLHEELSHSSQLPNRVKFSIQESSRFDQLLKKKWGNVIEEYYIDERELN